jgi:hypothetical protein
VRTTLVVVVGAVVLLSGLPGAAGAAAGTREPGVHLRPLTHTAATLLAEATTGSPVVRDLVARLEATDLVVYLEDAAEGCAPDLRACLRFLVAAGGVRYVVVRVDRWGVSPWDRIGWLAHELQHAVEIAGAPEVRDAITLARFYGGVGWQSGRNRFETSLARAAGTLARQQLDGTRR